MGIGGDIDRERDLLEVLSVRFINNGFDSVVFGTGGSVVAIGGTRASGSAAFCGRVTRLGCDSRGDCRIWRTLPVFFRLVDFSNDHLRVRFCAEDAGEAGAGGGS